MDYMGSLAPKHLAGSQKLSIRTYNFIGSGSSNHLCGATPPNFDPRNADTSDRRSSHIGNIAIGISQSLIPLPLSFDFVKMRSPIKS